MRNSGKSPHPGESRYVFKDRLACRGELARFDDPAYLQKIHGLLRRDPHNAFLLDVADEGGVAYHMHRAGELTAGGGIIAYLHGKDLHLIISENDGLGDQGPDHAHEARHFWQFRALQPYMRERKTGADYFVFNHLIEADAYAHTYRTAFLFKNWGQPRARGNCGMTGMFEDFYNEAMARGANELVALNAATSRMFAEFAGPGRLDHYEAPFARDIQRLKWQGVLEEQIAGSPFAQPEFLRMLTTIQTNAAVPGRPYLRRQDMEAALRKLPQIGHSKYAVPQRPHVQPKIFSLDEAPAIAA